MKFAKIETSKGLLVAQLYEQEAPNTVKHFSELVDSGFYEDMAFHKMVEKTLIQAGSKTGRPESWIGYFVKGEAGNNQLRHDTGVLSMVAQADGSISNQFFIVLDDERCQHLNGLHSCFAKVVDSCYPVLKMMRKGDVIKSIELSNEPDFDDSPIRAFSETL